MLGNNSLCLNSHRIRNRPGRSLKIEVDQNLKRKVDRHLKVKVDQNLKRKVEGNLKTSASDDLVDLTRKIDHRRELLKELKRNNVKWAIQLTSSTLLKKRDPTRGPQPRKQLIPFLLNHRSKRKALDNNQKLEKNKRNLKRHLKKKRKAGNHLLKAVLVMRVRKSIPKRQQEVKNTKKKGIQKLRPLRGQLKASMTDNQMFVNKNQCLIRKLSLPKKRDGDHSLVKVLAQRRNINSAVQWVVNLLSANLNLLNLGNTDTKRRLWISQRLLNLGNSSLTFHNGNKKGQLLGSSKIRSSGDILNSNINQSLPSNHLVNQLNQHNGKTKDNINHHDKCNPQPQSSHISNQGCNNHNLLENLRCGLVRLAKNFYLSTVNKMQRSKKTKSTGIHITNMIMTFMTT